MQLILEMFPMTKMMVWTGWFVVARPLLVMLRENVEASIQAGPLLKVLTGLGCYWVTELTGAQDVGDVLTQCFTTRLPDARLLFTFIAGMLAWAGIFVHDDRIGGLVRGKT
jgi:hypothetical protein